MKRILSRDPLTGSTTYFHIDQDGKIGIEEVQDVTQIVEANKRAQNDGTDGWTPSKDMKHVACIPLCILHQWALDAGVNINSKEMGEVIKKRMNDPDFAAFRTGSGHI